VLRRVRGERACSGSGSRHHPDSASQTIAVLRRLDHEARPDQRLDALIELLRETIERDRFPLSPRIRSLKAVLDKLDPPAPGPDPMPPPKPLGAPSLAVRRKKRR
jgi:hypothetical protein